MLERNIILDLLRLVLAFMVVGIHANFLEDISPLGSFLTVHGIFTIAVPIFLLISGFYFFPILNDGDEKIWIKRILILYIIWMFFYSYEWINIPDYSIVNIVKIFRRILFGYGHLWYLVGLLGAMIILKYMHKYSSAPIIWLSIIVAFIVGIFIEHESYYQFTKNETFQKLFSFDWVYRNFLFISYPFFTIGYMINRYSLHKFISIRSLLILSGIGFLLICTEAYYNFSTKQVTCDNLLSMLFTAPIVFMLFLKLNLTGDTKKLALYATSIYFIHIFILIHLFKDLDLPATLLTVVVFMTSIIASYFIIKLNNKIKYIL